MDKQESPRSGSRATQEGKSPAVNRVRRRLGKAALATPVIASLAARPAMACSISGFLSGNTSPGRVPPSCGGNGCTPGFWKNNPELWPSGFKAGQCSELLPNGKCKTWVLTLDATPLSFILPDSRNPFSNVASSSTAMFKIFVDGEQGQGVKSEYAFVCHYMAAILNAAAAPQLYGSTVDEVKAGLVKAMDAGGDKLAVFKDILAGLNERGCMFDSFGRCETGFTLVNGVCTPVCPDSTYIYDFNVQACVKKTTP